jgi:UDPglucose 6-dehydrogenase
MIGKRAEGYRLVIEKSTVPVQTGTQLRKYLGQHRNRRFDYDVASNPEFLREGSAVENFFHPDRIVVGVESERAEAHLREMYAPMLKGKMTCPVHPNCKGGKDVKFLVTDTNSAEMIKHASNSFLAMKISFINLIADLCEAAAADVTKVAEGMGLDPRIGPSFLQPGIGFGGFCFPKDLQAFARIAAKFNCNFALLDEVEKINLSRVGRFLEKIKRELWVLRGKRIAIWGLSFKPDTDDIRFSPAISLINRLLSEGAIIQAYDPAAMEKAKSELPNIAYCRDPYEAARDAEAIVLVTEWMEFCNLDWARLASLVEHPRVFDGRNLLRNENIAVHGFQYFGIGGVFDKPREAVPSLAIESPAPALLLSEGSAARFVRESPAKAY